MNSTRIGRAAAIAVLASAVLTDLSVAQAGKAGQVEVSAFGTFTKYDNSSVGLDSKLGSGGRLGLYLSRVFSIEASGDYTETTESATAFGVNVARVGGTLFAHTRPSIFGSPYVGMGYTRSFYRGAAEAQDNSGHLILGDRISVGGRTALRIEARLDYFPNSALSATDEGAFNFGGALGISIFTFGGPPRDADGDLVVDRRDQCPDTPRGVQVDTAGCPTDGDQDGVFDGPDQCPDTPAGAMVDAVGCPTDADSDGVFDGIDVCPNTPVGAAVDADGCPIDSDEDGVFDGIDQCPDTPQGAQVNPEGCPLDSDEDGVFDGIDQCPSTPAGVTVDGVGCPVDSDGDGVVNALDQCPNTAPGTEVDANGCPVVVDRDSDGDGVMDSVDRCPNTAPGQNVDAVGCPILFLVEEGVVRPLVLKGVHFETGRSALTPDSYSILNEVSTSLLAHPEVRIQVAGHTDITGPLSLNMRLSLQRAQSVMAYLARQGVDPSRMEAQGYGPDEPIATNATVDGRAQNRRVELRLIEGGPGR